MMNFFLQDLYSTLLHYFFQKSMKNIIFRFSINFSSSLRYHVDFNPSRGIKKTLKALSLLINWGELAWISWADPSRILSVVFAESRVYSS